MPVLFFPDFFQHGFIDIQRDLVGRLRFEEAERQRIYGMMMEITTDGDIIDTETNLLLPNGQRLRAHIRFSQISANSARKKYICVILAL